jgi:hypothetical protein
VAKLINVPKSLLDSDKATNLEPAAKRLLVTAWAICDESGKLLQDNVPLAEARWGDGLARDERLLLKEILQDMQKLGFIRDLRERSAIFQFKRSGDWLS